MPWRRVRVCPSVSVWLRTTNAIAEAVPASSSKDVSTAELRSVVIATPVSLSAAASSSRAVPGANCSDSSPVVTACIRSRLPSMSSSDTVVSATAASPAACVAALRSVAAASADESVCSAATVHSTAITTAATKAAAHSATATIAPLLRVVRRAPSSEDAGSLTVFPSRISMRPLPGAVPAGRSPPGGRRRPGRALPARPRCRLRAGRAGRPFPWWARSHPPDGASRGTPARPRKPGHRGVTPSSAATWEAIGRR